MPFSSHSSPHILVVEDEKHLGVGIKYNLEAEHYRVTLVEDGHSTWNTQHLTAPQIITHHNDVLGGWFATLKRSPEITFGEE